MDNIVLNMPIIQHRIKVLKIAFWGYWIGWLFAIVFSLYDEKISNIVSVFFVLLMLISWIVYLVKLGQLVSEAKKSVITWVGGTFIFQWIGLIVSYAKLKTLAKDNGWN